jgi:polygalacturonase
MLARLRERALDGCGGTPHIVTMLSLGLGMMAIPRVSSEPLETVFDVTKYGAAGDGVIDDSAAIVMAMAAAAAELAGDAAGAATVAFPAGKIFLTKPINISSSGLTLQVDGTILGITGNNSAHGRDYILGLVCKPVPWRNGGSFWECPNNNRSTFPAAPAGPYSDMNASKACHNAGTGIYNPANQSWTTAPPRCHPVDGSVWPVLPGLPTGGDTGGTHYQALIQAAHVRDIAIKGSGAIDGGGDWWWAENSCAGCCCRGNSARGYDEPNGSNPHQSGCYGCTKPTEVPGMGRPHLVEFYNVTNVKVAGVELRRPAFWLLHLAFSKNVWIHDITIVACPGTGGCYGPAMHGLLQNGSDAHIGAPNLDGIDPNSCQDVVIERCDISSGKCSACLSILYRSA